MTPGASPRSLLRAARRRAERILDPDANGARLESCGVAWRYVTVQVRVTGPRWLGQVADLTAEARAGPG